MKCLILLYLSGFIIATAGTGCDSPNHNNFSKVDSASIVTFTAGEIKIKDLYGEAKQMLPVIHDITGTGYRNIKDIYKDANTFTTADVYATESDDEIPDSTRQLLEQFKTIVIAKQVKVFPLMRKAYKDELAKDLSRKSINITGKENEIKFAGPLFASDSIVDSFREQMRPQLELLRFKHITFSLTDSSTSYSRLNSKKDEDID